MLAVGHDIRCLLLAAGFRRGMLTEVHAADQLPYYHKVNASGRDISPQRTGGRQVVEHPGGTDVGVQPHGGPQLQKPPLRTVRGGLAVPLRTAYRAKKHAVRPKARGKAFVRQGDSVDINGIPAHGGLLVGKAVAEFYRRRVQYPNRFSYNLGTNAVAPNHSYRLVHASAFPAFREAISPPLAIMSLMNGGKGSA